MNFPLFSGCVGILLGFYLFYSEYGLLYGTYPHKNKLNIFMSTLVLYAAITIHNMFDVLYLRV